MTRDAEMAASDYVTLVLQNIGSETDAFGIRAIPATPRSRSTCTPTRPGAPSCARTWEAGLRDLLHAAEPGSNAQLIFARAYAAAARQRRGQRRGRRAARRLAVGRRPRHRHRPALGAAGRARQVRCGRRRRDRRGARARPHHLRPGERRCRARLTPGRRRQGCRVDRPGRRTPTYPTRHTARSRPRSCGTARRTCSRRTSRSTSRRPTPSGRSSAPTWRRTCSRTRSRCRSAARTLVERIERWLEESPATAAAKRYVREGRADVIRALAAQARDAEG